MRLEVGRNGAVFLDRDGTINAKMPEGDYVKCPGELTLLPGAARAVAEINRASRKVIVITNQRGIALGRMSEADLRAVHGRLQFLVGQAAGGSFTGFIHCPHDKDECECRKPQPGMFWNAATRWPDVNLRESVMIGDSWSDVQAAEAAGIAALHIGVDVPDLLTAVLRRLSLDPPLWSGKSSGAEI
jgi:D-glycero-D-manno-heptose 1,7-bisphosphate phosphatase